MLFDSWMLERKGKCATVIKVKSKLMIIILICVVKENIDKINRTFLSVFLLYIDTPNYTNL